MYKINRKEVKPDIEAMWKYMIKSSKEGIRISPRTPEIYSQYQQLKETLAREFTRQYGVANPNSPAQLSKYIQEEASKNIGNARNDYVEICYDSQTGKWTTNAYAISQLADLGYDFAVDLLEYRKVKKYAETLAVVIENCDSKGLIHPEVTLTKTNRLSYAHPALMNIQKELLWDVIAPRHPENSLYSVDIKNEEPQLLICMVNATELIPALQSPSGLYNAMFEKCFEPKVHVSILINMLPETKVYTQSELVYHTEIDPILYSSCKAPTGNIVYAEDIESRRLVSISSILMNINLESKTEINKINELTNKISSIMPKTIRAGLNDNSAVDIELNNIGEAEYREIADYIIGQLTGSGLVEITRKFKNGALKVIPTDQERREFKISWLAISYGASVFGIEKICKTIDGKRVYNYITTINGLRDYRKAISSLANKGVTTIGTIFGTVLDAEMKVNKRSQASVNRLKRILLDLPIQGSCAEILALLVERFNTYTKENGLDDKMKIYYTRHDELIIEVAHGTEDKLEIESLLREILEFQIDDWVPFKVEVTRL